MGTAAMAAFGAANSPRDDGTTRRTLFGSWNRTTGQTTGAGGLGKWVAGWMPGVDEETRAAAGIDYDTYLTQQRIEAEKAKADRNAIDLTDRRAREVAAAARRRTGRGLSSTFVTGQGVGGSLLGGG